MHEMIAFFKDIFMMNSAPNASKVGLSQFKEGVSLESKKVELKSSKEIKISDLMRRSSL